MAQHPGGTILIGFAKAVATVVAGYVISGGSGLMTFGVKKLGGLRCQGTSSGHIGICQLRERRGIDP
jgi:hypothetical protein